MLGTAVSVEIRTDCRTVSGIMKFKPNPMIARWLTLFMALDVKVVFLNGNENTFSDLLSRQVFAADGGGPKAPAPNDPSTPSIHTVEKNLLKYSDAKEHMAATGECRHLVTAQGDLEMKKVVNDPREIRQGDTKNVASSSATHTLLWLN